MVDDNKKWRTWDADDSYGQTLYKRATGELPEMQSAKAAGRQVKAVWQLGDSILDVGCGAGHYLRTLRQILGSDFSYTGVDATENYLNLARKAFHCDPNAQFQKGDIFDLPFADASHDVVICNNVLLHLPSIAKPMSELVRIARKKVIVRTLCGERTFLIRDVVPEGSEFDEANEPITFNHFNIYSRNYVTSLLSRLPNIASFEIDEDRDFDSSAINRSADENNNRANSTHMIGDFQVNGYILQPWAFVKVTKSYTVS